MSDDDKILEIDPEGSATVVENENSSEEEFRDKEENAIKVSEEPVPNDPSSEPQYKTSVLTETEYKTLKSTLSTIAALKSSLPEGVNNEVALQRLKLLEVSLWDELVKKFGFRTTEEARAAGYTFGLRQLHVVECRKTT